MMPLLGNVAWKTKKILRTRNDLSLEMHSNGRERVCPCTLVDRKRKRYDNAVDVVVRLHDQLILVRMAPPRSAHVQLDDVPRTPIQPSVEGEFH